VSAINQIVAGYGLDPDASAFITAAGITDATQKAALNTLVAQLKGYGIWTKMTAIYPFVGGTATTHKYNLKDPRDLDAAFRIVWSGAVTHNSNGVTGDGSTGFGDTKLVPSTSLTSNDTHLSVYGRSAGLTATNPIDAGAFTGGTSAFFMGTRLNDKFYSASYNNAGDVAVSNTDGRGFYIASRRSSSDMEAYKNGASSGTSAAAAGTLPTTSTYVCGGGTSGGVTNPSNRNLALVSVGAGLTSTEAANFNTAVQAYQTTLSRNV
jgi:hypothetical protein